ncbi:hypothetical protein RRG08_043125 [Elysia crispata]|uniref:Uncharacterized protein n=1 Tax=Elysia crispata TaxID=231223 RepID=A0AAE0XYQ0_9GAST|nr:hypothetical protein RRG08_043125 [Elysia crispata]
MRQKPSPEEPFLSVSWRKRFASAAAPTRGWFRWWGSNLFINHAATLISLGSVILNYQGQSKTDRRVAPITEPDQSVFTRYLLPLSPGLRLKEGKWAPLEGIARGVTVDTGLS